MYYTKMFIPKREHENVLNINFLPTRIYAMNWVSCELKKKETIKKTLVKSASQDQKCKMVK